MGDKICQKIESPPLYNKARESSYIRIVEKYHPTASVESGNSSTFYFGFSENFFA